MLINKYIWLTETLRRGGRLTLEDISRKYEANEDLSGGNPLPERTFHKWRIAAEQMFDINIICDRTDGYRYYIEGDAEEGQRSLRNWLFSNMATSNLISESRQLKNRIMVEDIPSGLVHLQPIIEAMKAGHCLQIGYCPFGGTDVHWNTVQPYAVRLFRQRWYLLACKKGELRIYGLDRITGTQELDETFLFPPDFDLEEYFRGCIGVMANEENPIEEVRLKVTARQANYLRTLKWDPSQVEEERNEDYSIFSLRVRGTIELKQKIFQQADAMEVLSPQWLRKEMKDAVKRMQQMYSE